MPTIPLLDNPSPLPNAAAPVLNRQQYPTVDQSGVLQGLSKLGQSDQLPLEDPKALASPYAALGAVGDAIQKAGGVMEAFAAKKYEATTDFQVGDAATKMAMFNADFDQFKRDSPDPTTWTPELQTRLQAFGPNLTDDSLNQTSAARQKIALMWQNHSGQLQADTNINAGTKAFNLAASNAGDAALGAIQNVDPDGLHNILYDPKTGAVPKGYMTPKQGELYEIHMQKAVKQNADQQKANSDVAQWVQMQTQIASDPVKFIQDNATTTWPGADEYRMKGIEYAHSVLNVAQKKMTDDVTDGMISGQITVPSQIDAMYSGNPMATPALVASMKDKVFGMNQEQAQQNKIAQGPQNAQGAYNMVQSYSRDQDPNGTGYFNLKSWIKENVPETLGKVPLDTLDRKFSGLPEQITAPKPVQDDITETIHNVVNQTIPVKSDQEVKRYTDSTPASGSLWWKTPGHNVGDPIPDASGQPMLVFDTAGNPKMLVDQAAKQRNEDAFASIQTQMDQWYRDNPSKANDLQSAKDALFKLMPDGARGQMLQNSLQKTLTPQGNWQGKLPAGLQPYAQSFINAGKANGVDPKVLAAISALETAGGTSKAFREKNNAMGISDDSGPVQMPSVDESISHMAKTLADPKGPYKNAKTLRQIGAIYAPPGAKNDINGTNAGWADGVQAYLSHFQ